MEDAQAGVAAEGEVPRGQEAGGNLVEMAAERRVVERRVARVVAEGEVFEGEQVGGQVAE